MTSSIILPPSLDSELTGVPPWFLASGVGSNGDDPVTEVRGAEGCRWKAIPLDIEAERGQVPDNLSPYGSVVDGKDVRHVLHQDVSGSKVANGAGHLAPQNGLGMLEAVAEASGRGALAGEPSRDEDGSLSSSINCSDIIVDSDSRPAMCEEFPAPRVDLAEPGVLPASEGEAVGKEPDPVEKSADTQHRGLSLLM